MITREADESTSPSAEAESAAGPSPRLRRRWLPVAGVVAAAVGLRAAFLASTLLRLEGDEAVTGLMAQRILDGKFVAFFPGQGYMGSGEQYLQAVALWLLPDTPFVLRLPQLLLAGLACAGVYRLARACFESEGRALLAAALFAVGPFYNVFWSVKSRGAYLTGLLAGLAGLLIALCIRPGDPRLRLKLFAFGLAAGLGFWANWQAAYLLLPAGWWVLGTLRLRALREAPLAVAGFVVGAAPSLGHLLFTGPLQASGVHPPSTLGDRAEGLVRVALPQFVGSHDGGAPMPAWLTPTGTAAAVLALIAVAAYRRRRGLVALLRLRASEREPFDLVLLCVLLSPFLHLQSKAAGSPSFTYLFALYAVVPVLLAGLVPAWSAGGWRRAARPLVAGGLVTLALAQTATVARRQLDGGGGGAPVASGEIVRTEALPEVVDALVASGARAAFADYWLAMPLQFLAGDRLVVSPTYAQRFEDLTIRARCDPSPALVVPSGAPADALRQAVGAAGSTAHESEVEGLTLFTGVEPGLRPGVSLAMHTALEPLPVLPDPSCRGRLPGR